MADEIRVELKNHDWPARYKCVVFVAIGQKNQQGVSVTSMCAWNADTDNYTSCSFQNESLFCVVTMFAVYFE